MSVQSGEQTVDVCVFVRVCQQAVAEDKDMYEEYLTQREIQDHISAVNGEK